MNLSAVIVDDELPSRKNLKSILGDYFTDIRLLGMAEDVDSAFDLINDVEPDLVFLDVELLDKTGFDLLTKFTNPTFEVIFITAYEDYAVRSYRTMATDYILKPIDIDELREAILKVKTKISTKLSEIARSNDAAIIPSQIGKSNYIKVSTTDGFEMILIEDIVYLQSINYYTNIVLTNKREIITSKHLKDYEEQLRGFRFFRIHNSYIINIDFLKGVVSKEGYFAELNNGLSLKISRRRKDEFIQFIES